jgi:hypothetical protein
MILEERTEMQPHEFLNRLANASRKHVPPAFQAFHHGTRFSLSQLWYGNRDVHYEVWLRPRERRLEIGLHFEADPLTNARLLAAFRAHAHEIHRALGEETRIEDWDKGWARVWEPVSLAPLDGEFLERVASRVAAYIDALEPILRDALPADFAWKEPDARTAHDILPRSRRSARRRARGRAT